MLKAPNLTFLDSSHLRNPNEVYFWQWSLHRIGFAACAAPSAALQRRGTGDLRVWYIPGMYPQLCYQLRPTGLKLIN